MTPTGAASPDAARASGRAIGTVVLSFWHHAVGMAAGFATVAWLARVLGPDGWGPLLLAQGLTAWLLVVGEYALDLSVARQLAEARTQANAAALVTRITGDALTARLALALVMTLGWVAAVALLPMLRADARLAAGALAVVVIRGLTPMWYFVGMERLRGALLVDLTGRVASAVAVFVWVATAVDAWRVLAAQAAVGVLVLLVLGIWLAQDLARSDAPVRLTLAGAQRIVREGFLLFAARATGALYMQLNPVLVGAMASPVVVAMFGGAERIVRAGVSMLEPVTRVVVARVSHLRGTDVGAADRLVARLLLGGGALSTLAAAAGAMLAPHVVSLLLGPGYDAAVPVLRVLLLLLPITTVATVIGYFAAVPQGHDRIVLWATLCAGVCNLLLAAPLTAWRGATGMAMSVVTAEALVALILGVWYLRRRRPVTVDARVVGATS